MRPLGDVSVALLVAAQRLQSTREAQPLVGLDGQPLVGATWREIAGAGMVGWDAARDSVKNLVRSGHLQLVGLVREEHSNRPVGVYAPGTPGGAAQDAEDAPDAGARRLQSAWQAMVAAHLMRWRGVAAA